MPEIYIDFSPENIGKLFHKAVDEAMEQHRIKGESISISEHGKVKRLFAYNEVKCSDSYVLSP
jgi:hypothetical protein